MSAAAQREDLKLEPAGGEDVSAGHAGSTAPQSAALLRQLAAERVAAHRNRRAASLTPRDTVRRAVPESSAVPSARPSVRDAVAARYRQSPSYQEFLAAEAERAVQRAEAQAEVAARNALAVAEAQRQLLDEIEHWNQADPTAPTRVQTGPQAVDQPLFIVEPFDARPETQPAPTPAPKAARSPRRAGAPEAQPAAAAPLTVQLYADLPQSPLAPSQAKSARFDSEELEEDHPIETLPIQANIIEFPRQLVATRKARPRLAEGPLREDGTPEPQLRIFEVEPEQVSTEPEPAPTAAPEWQSLLLAPAAAAGTWAAPSPEQVFDTALDIAPQAALIYSAPVSRRVMAMAVDAVCVGAGLTAFCALAARLCGPALHDAPRPELGIAAAVALLVFGVLYQLLFFCLNEATPGMVYARLGLCTFADANPSRRAVRRRLWATAVAVSPVGLGLVWMLLDPDGLGWHDRISRMYPRAY
jgi:uncharacterized RDD family membrane protein YckC